MAEVLLSFAYDTAEFKSPELPREPIAGPYGRVVNAEPLELQRALHEAAGAHLPRGYMEKNKMDVNYYSCIAYGDNQIYTHNAVTGLTTVYDIRGKFLAAMQYKNKVSKVRGNPYRTWRKMIVSQSCLYATDGNLIYRMEKYPLTIQQHDVHNTAEWNTLLKTRILKHPEVAPAKSMYAEHTNGGITDITGVMDDLFIVVGWHPYIYRYAPSGCLRYNLGKFSKMATIENRLYVMRINKIDIYNISELVSVADSQLNTVCVPYATFTIHASQASNLIAYGRFIIVVAHQHTHTYTSNGIYCDTAYFPEPIVDFCPALGGFLVSHKSYIALYK